MQGVTGRWGGSPTRRSRPGRTYSHGHTAAPSAALAASFPRPQSRTPNPETRTPASPAPPPSASSPQHRGAVRLASSPSRSRLPLLPPPCRKPAALLPSVLCLLDQPDGLLGENRPPRLPLSTKSRRAAESGHPRRPCPSRSPRSSALARRPIGGFICGPSPAPFPCRTPKPGIRHYPAVRADRISGLAASATPSEIPRSPFQPRLDPFQPKSAPRFPICRKLQNRKFSEIQHHSAQPNRAAPCRLSSWPLYPRPRRFPIFAHQLPTNFPLVSHSILPYNPPRLPQDAKSALACFPLLRNRDFGHFWETTVRSLSYLSPIP